MEQATAPVLAPGDGFAQVFWTAFEHSANGMVLVDLERVIIAANAASERILGRAPRRLRGVPWPSLLDDEAEALDDAAWLEQVRRGDAAGRRSVRRPDGSVMVVDYAA